MPGTESHIMLGSQVPESHSQMHHFIALWEKQWASSLYPRLTEDKVKRLKKEASSKYQSDTSS